jgi:apolipoprotein N-acyltransferase
MISSRFASPPFPSWLSSLRPLRSLWLMAFLGAALLWAALPPVDWWPLAWVAPIPWVMLSRRKELSARRPYAVLTLAGFCFWMAALHWLRLPHPATYIGWVALSSYFAFYLPVFVGLSRVAVHRLRVPAILAAPIVWAGLELARGHLLTGMTMGSLGHTQYRWVSLIQLSDFAGAYGVSFVVMFVAACLATMIPNEYQPFSGRACPPRSAADSPRGGQARRLYSVARWTWPLLPAAAMLAAALFYGHIRMEAASTKPGPRIALIQGSIDIEMLDDRSALDARREHISEQYYGLTRQAVEQNPGLDLIVWPETMFPYPLITLEPGAQRPAEYPTSDAQFFQDMGEWTRKGRDALAQLAKSVNIPVLVGVDAPFLGPKGERQFNSAAYVAADGHLVGRYDKMHLVLFGEYTPLVEYLPWLNQLTPLTGSATPGERPAAFEVRGVRIAPNICYESVLPHVIRRQVNTLAAEGREPEILVNLTNDGWFWGSSELDMHLACGAFRAVECRKPLLIAANTGFSAWIDANGRIQAQGPRRAQTVIIAEPRLDQRRSWYLAHGDWFSGVCLAMCGLCGLVGICGRWRTARGWQPVDLAPTERS